MTATLVQLQADRVALGLVDQVELLVVDNEPNGPDGEDNKNIVARFANSRYIPAGDIVGTSAPRNRIFTEARGQWVMVIDSHVFLMRGVLERLVEFCRENPADQDLHHGPLYSENLQSLVWTHWAEVWGEDGMFGKMRSLPAAMLLPESPPVEIAGAGCGLFLCRKEAWLPFHPQQQHFGGEELTAHERFRQHGRKVWLQPWLGWWHKFRRQSLGVPFPTDWVSRASNYLHTYKELGYPDLAAIRHAHVQPGRVRATEWAALIRDLGVVPRPRGNAPGMIGAGPGTELLKILQGLGIVSTPDCPCTARALQMDEWGVCGCINHRDEIITWLAESASGVGWAAKLWTIPMGLKNGLATKVNWLDPIPGLVDMAIQRAEAQEQAAA